MNIKVIWISHSRPHNARTSHHSNLLKFGWCSLIKIFPILSHLKQLAIPLVFSYFLRCKSNFFELFLLPYSTLILLSLHKLLLIQLIVKVLSIISAHTIKAFLLWLPPLLASLFLLLKSLLYELILESIALLIEKGMIASYRVLIIQKRLVVLSLRRVTFL